jgi:hypothetical protein
MHIAEEYPGIAACIGPLEFQKDHPKPVGFISTFRMRSEGAWKFAGKFKCADGVVISVCANREFRHRLPVFRYAVETEPCPNVAKPRY